jgi:Fic family protein
VLRAAVAHFWFVTIHPFDDGNGRIARAIADMALSRADGSKDRFYSMSAAIEAARTEYYIRLESAQGGSLDITAWAAWFLGCLDQAITSAEMMLASVLRKARLWQRINTKPVNERQRTVINRLLAHDWVGHLSTSKYARIAACARVTALRDIKDLVERDLLVANDGGGRSTSYRLSDPETRSSSS